MEKGQMKVSPQASRQLLWLQPLSFPPPRSRLFLLSSQLPKPHLPALSPCLRTVQDFLLLKTLKILFSLCILAACDPLR